MEADLVRALWLLMFLGLGPQFEGYDRPLGAWRSVGQTQQTG